MRNIFGKSRYQRQQDARPTRAHQRGSFAERRLYAQQIAARLLGEPITAAVDSQDFEQITYKGYPITYHGYQIVWYGSAPKQSRRSSACAAIGLSTGRARARDH